jgi:hypothetical protein
LIRVDTRIGRVHDLNMTNTTQNEITVSGQRYLVLELKPYEYKGRQRVSLTVRKPRGRNSYTVIVYENGSMSEAV